jgi:broad specificity phosphatase PhoE
MKTITSIITTHGGRMRCLLKELNANIAHYKNCCILELGFYLRKDKIHYHLDMIYSGFNDKHSKKYFTALEKDADEKNILFPSKAGETKNLLGLTPRTLNSNIVYRFFIIRHAQSTHNLYTTLSKIKGPFKLDTSLTTKGITQAKKAGEFLHQYLLCSKLKIDNLFCSDLKRTRQTMLFLCSSLKLLKAHKMSVLPCAHELPYTKDIDCDKNMLRSIHGITGENRMNCETSCIDKKDQCCEIKYRNLSLKIDWSIYNHFYGNSTRSAVYILDSNKACTHTNMLKEAVKYID